MKRIVLSLLAAAVTLSATLGAAAQNRNQNRPPQSRVEEGSCKSELLGVEKKYLVYLPAGYDENPTREYPVLYLLHGAGGNYTVWRDRGQIKTLVDEHIESGLSQPLIVVMPDASGPGGMAAKSRGYFNKPGWPYEDHFFTEFIPHVEKTYRIAGDRKHRAVAGQSMGGGGSAGYAQKHPEMFSSACPLSGALVGMGRDTSAGSNVDFVRDATPTQVEALRGVRWWVDCGDDDHLWAANIDFYRAMKEKNIPLQYRTRNGGHNWEYWQTALPSVLTFISIGFSE